MVAGHDRSIDHDRHSFEDRTGDDRRWGHHEIRVQIHLINLPPPPPSVYKHDTSLFRLFFFIFFLVTKEEEGSPTSHLLRIIDVLIRVMKCLEYVRTYGPSSVRRKKVSGGSNTPSTLSSVRRDIRALFELTNRSIQRRFIEAIYLNGGFFIYLFFILFIYFILFYFVI